MVAAVAALGVGVLTAPASAATVATPISSSLSDATIADSITSAPATSDTTEVITDSQIASSGVIQGTPVAVSVPDELVRAQAAGVDASGLSAIASSTTCWYWNTQVYYKNLIGQVILRFHVQPNWCTTGYWLVSPVYTNTWPTINVPGWSYKKGDTNWHRYGAGWNLYVVHRSGHFCFLQTPYTQNCAANKYPWIEDEVGPGSQTDYFHHGG
jgi:hypothetical protein